MRPLALRIFLLLLVFLAGCSPAAPRETDSPPSPIAVPTDLPQITVDAADYWPDARWRTSTPAEQGMDGANLSRMVAEVRERGLNLHSLLVIRHGYLVSETYFNGYNSARQHEIYSVTKSFSATLIGIALDQGLIQSVDQKIVDLLPPSSVGDVQPGIREVTSRKRADHDGRVGLARYGRGL